MDFVGRGISALFQVSREFSLLAAPYLFQVQVRFFTQRLRLARTVSSTLSHFTLSSRSDIYADAAILKPIFRGVTFPSVTRLLLGGHYYCIDDAYGTITREAFPLLTYLDLDLRNPDAIAEWDELWVSLVDPLFSFAYLETVSISHLAEMNPSLASTLSKSCREIDVELLPLPFTESCPPFLRNTHLPEEDTRVLRQVESLETTLKDLEVQLKKAKVEEDETALSEIEKVSRPAEVKRIEREMWGKA
ncbi:hypothetical protein JCM11641_002438 [Rhodosporidiobolus odoratus]